jgi:hypothetical protein
MVAALDTKPEARPVMGSPIRGPITRSEMYPVALMDMMDMMRITIFHIVRGFKALYGPIYWSGARGNSTSAAAARIRASLSSVSLRLVLTKR